MTVYELNLDGLVGPTHNYAGLAPGNLASTYNAQSVSNPMEAALQGIAKMRFLHKLGLKQAIFPPHQRPNLELLYQLGFTGSPISQINKASRLAPELLSAAYSASSMWAANAATVSASLDTKDKRVHFTTANLISNLHRQQEASFSSYLLQQIFNNERYFVHHPVLPTSLISADEGAANHSRFCQDHGKPGINLFVYGKKGFNKEASNALFYPARQTLEASMANARAHQLDLEKTLFACQNPKAIDAGVFHNDVIATANESLLLIHEEAFLQQKDLLLNLQTKANFEIQIVELSSKRLSLKEAVQTYLFNSQVISLPGMHKQMLLLAPSECEKNVKVKTIIEEFIAEDTNPINQVEYLDLRQSMRNGGGPACLRLRIPLNEEELKNMHQGVLVTDSLLEKLENWIKRHYRDQLNFRDLCDPLLIDEVLKALDELSQLLHLGPIYPFQKV